MKYQNIREEELKNKVGADFFKDFDTTEIIGNIDFAVLPLSPSERGGNTAKDNAQNTPLSRRGAGERISLLWAEAKTGNYDLATMFVQLILTIGKARSFDKMLPPAFLGAFDFQKIAFVPYIAVQDIFYQNDFNWNVTPSNHQTKEFQLIKERVENSLKQNQYIFDYEKDEKELRFFIKNNIAGAKTSAKIKIDKNNVLPIYLRWLETVKPLISVDWDDLKKVNILDCDFYIADLFVDDKNTANISDDTSIQDGLFVVFKDEGYRISKENLKQMFDASISIKDKEAYQSFWKIYKRPPLKEYHDFIIEHRHLFVPQDVRERKGAFFTPRQWVELSQKYLADVFGENWQEEYYIWDCAAGTGNLLAGLTNKYNIYASTLDQADVNVMHERIEHGANLLKAHCFQFDFLNDEFGEKLPASLLDILNNEEKRKKLIIYINPPYAEATTAKTVAGTGNNKAEVSKGNKIHTKYKPIIKQAANEMFALFLIRIYKEIPLSKIANFSTLKNLQSSNFSYFRKEYRAKLEKFFGVPADTFDNVKGQFPISFQIWNGEKEELFIEKKGDFYNKNGIFIEEKTISAFDNIQRINKWIKLFDNKNINAIGFMENPTPDFQNNKFLNISEIEGSRHNNYLYIYENNLIPASIYFAVRHCIDATWLNDRDQFLYPNDGWLSDTDFQNDCLAFTLFHGQNRIASPPALSKGEGAGKPQKDNSKNSSLQTPSPLEGGGGGLNHWLPFTESEVDAPERFESDFMVKFLASPPAPLQRRGEQNGQTQLNFDEPEPQNNHTQTPLSLGEGQGVRTFSPEATAVFDAGRELWKYYFVRSTDRQFNNERIRVRTPSLYDIREYFQQRDDKGRMKNKSDDEHYMMLIGELRDRLRLLAEKIQPKVFEYGFLRS